MCQHAKHKFFLSQHTESNTNVVEVLSSIIISMYYGSSAITYLNVVAKNALQDEFTLAFIMAEDKIPQVYYLVDKAAPLEYHSLV